MINFLILIDCAVAQKAIKTFEIFPREKKNSTSTLITHHQKKTSGENFIHVEKLRAFEKR